MARTLARHARDEDRSRRTCAGRSRLQPRVKVAKDRRRSVVLRVRRAFLGCPAFPRSNLGPKVNPQALLLQGAVQCREPDALRGALLGHDRPLSALFSGRTVGLGWSVMRRALVLLLATALWPVGCATYREDLNRGQRMYEENQYEHALALFRALEEDTDSLSPSDRARYAYLRGMTDYRLGFRADSRYWLALAKATDKSHAGSLSAAWEERLEQSLTDLNQDAYGAAENSDASGSHAVEYGKVSDGGGAVDAGSGSEAPSPPLEPGRCRSNADCKAGEICDGKSCTPL